jgi:hypothetical protein
MLVHTDKPMIPIIDLIGRTPSVVERLIGEPEKKETIDISGSVPTLKTYYQNGQVSILYIDNVADWITVFGVDSTSASEFIMMLGINPVKDDLKYGGKMSYLDVCGLSEVLVYSNSDGNIWMLHIKAFTL